MNQKSLIITAVAIVAIGVGIGLWLSGGQSGPLVGTIGSTPTSVTLSVTVLGVDETGVGDRLLQFSGTLKDSGGTPAPGRC